MTLLVAGVIIKEGVGGYLLMKQFQQKSAAAVHAQLRNKNK